MDIKRVDSQEYETCLSRHVHIFNSSPFVKLNASKCQQVHFLLFVEKKVRLGIVLGEKDNKLYSPFSAPFGGFDVNSPDRIEYYESAVRLLHTYSLQNNKKIYITLPPPIYGSSVAKSFSAFIRSNIKLIYSDLNYSYSLEFFSEFEEHLERSAKKNFHQGARSSFVFQKLDSNSYSAISRVYSVIQINRASKGYPLKMTLEEVINTSAIVSPDFFIMTLDNTDVAAAMVYKTGQRIAQVVYWGDNPLFSELKVMNFFTYKVFEYYFSQGFRVLDIGPSSEYGIPNYGLCSFKENIGCEVSLKHSFQL